MRLTRAELIRAFADRPELADRVAREIDANHNGVLSKAELTVALTKLQGDGLDAAALRDGMKRLFGDDAASALPNAAAVTQRVLTEQSVQGITQVDLMRDLRVLTKDPVLSIREASSPTYKKAAEWVAGQLKAAGAKPLGDDGSYFQAFRWEDRYARGVVSSSSNVIGRLEGKGKEPREAVLVIAHLDNLSKAEKDWYVKNEGRAFPKYEGANDNTASVAAVLEVARALQEAGGNQRDVIFLIPSAEEDGLKGTEAFVKAPPVPLDRIVGAVNLEMIGRNATDQLLVYGGNTNAEAERNPLYARAMKVGEQAGVTLRSGPDNDDGEGWYQRSDHFVTANAGIPSVMFFGRTTEGNYHTATDTLEELNMEKVQVTAQQVLRVVRDLANDSAATEKRGAPKASLNTYPGRVWPGSA